MSQKGFATILLLIPLVVLVILGGLFFFNLPKNNIQQNLSQSSCPKSLAGAFTYPIIKPDKIFFISPLGNLNPPGHNLPTDHLYFVTRASNDDPVVKVEVFAPADLTISTIEETKAYLKSGEPDHSDHTINLSICRGVSVGLGNIQLSEEVEKIKLSGEKNCHTGKKSKETSVESCAFKVNHKIKAGSLLGWTGTETSAGLDVGGTNYNLEKLNFISPNRYSEDNLHAFCPLDLYSGELKETLFNKLGGHDGIKRSQEPRCGTNMQDLAGTAEGAWFNGSVNEKDLELQGKVVSLVHENDEPFVGALISGGEISKPGKIHFIPQHSGIVNREFSEIKPSNQIYCYHEENADAGNQYYIEGQMIIQLIDDKTLKIEHQQGGCDTSVNFTSPTTYER